MQETEDGIALSVVACWTKLLKANSICLTEDIDGKSLCFPSTPRDDGATLIYGDLLIYRLFK